MTDPLSKATKQKMREDLAAATQGDWEDREERIRELTVKLFLSSADAHHIANCSPVNVRALLEENASLEAERDRLRSRQPTWVYCNQHGSVHKIDVDGTCWCGCIDDLPNVGMFGRLLCARNRADAYAEARRNEWWLS